MTVVRYKNPIPKVFSNFFNDNLDFWNNPTFGDVQMTLPPVNIKENPDAFVVEVAAPGYDKEDFNLEVKNDVLTISSEKQYENETKKGEEFTKREFSYQAFTRSFQLPDMVESDNIHAKYENGILMIEIPKKEEAKPKPVKMISVK